MKLNRDQVMALLPHRPPFLLVDEALEVEPGVRCLAQRTLQEDDFWFAGHFPGNPVMPGVLIIEALAQTATLAAASAADASGRIGLFAGIDKVRFKRVVKPGDTLTLEAEIIAVHGPVGRAKVAAKVDGSLACRGELMFAVVEAESLAAGEAKL
jgi:3-hydroxyacyl-[acyl-carrier-protein] dehydratase